jgi:hypothetical protein
LQLSLSAAEEKGLLRQSEKDNPDRHGIQHSVFHAARHQAHALTVNDCGFLSEAVAISRKNLATQIKRLNGLRGKLYSVPCNEIQ